MLSLVVITSMKKKKKVIEFPVSARHRIIRENSKHYCQGEKMLPVWKSFSGSCLDVEI